MLFYISCMKYTYIRIIWKRDACPRASENGIQFDDTLAVRLSKPLKRQNDRIFNRYNSIEYRLL